MKLTQEEKTALVKEILDDLPEGFCLFPPWMWLALTEILLLLLGGGWLAGTLDRVFQLHPGFSFGIAMFICVFGVCTPNLLIIQAGKNTLGIRYLRVVAILYIILSIPDVYLEWPKPIAYSPAILFATIVLWITYTIRFQAFALHQKRMADWRRERFRKNKLFREEIKRKRRLAGGK